MAATGRCLCGAVSFVADKAAAEVQVCHCSMCRRWAGGPVFSLEVGSVSFEGKENIQGFDSSAWGERGFCRRCGSHLFYRPKDGGHYFLSMGAFDDPAPFKVAGEIYIDAKPPGYDLAGDHPRLTGEEFLASLEKG